MLKQRMTTYLYLVANAVRFLSHGVAGRASFILRAVLSGCTYRSSEA